MKLSVAFTKEDSAETASETLLPDRAISAGPNLVTETGLRALEARLKEARDAYEAASAIEDVNERRRRAASPLRDMRYLAERVRTAQVVPAPISADAVAFGSTVTLAGVGGRLRRYRIVGEDEADPGAGTISHLAPLAQLLIGKSLGEVVTVGGNEFEIATIS